MSDNIREMISALLDDEASEIEIHKIVRRMNDDGQVKTSLLAWQQIRAAAKNDVLMSRQHHLQLAKRISAEVEKEPLVQATGLVNAKGRYRKPVVGLAIAASVALAFFVGGFYMDYPGSETHLSNGGFAETNESTIQPQTSRSQPVSPRYVSVQDADPEMLVELDEEKRRMVRQYLLQHERMTRLNPDLRAVTFDQKEPQ